MRAQSSARMRRAIAPPGCTWTPTLYPRDSRQGPRSSNELSCAAPNIAPQRNMRSLNSDRNPQPNRRRAEDLGGDRPAKGGGGDRRFEGFGRVRPIQGKNCSDAPRVSTERRKTARSRGPLTTSQWRSPASRSASTEMGSLNGGNACAALNRGSAATVSHGPRQSGGSCPTAT